MNWCAYHFVNSTLRDGSPIPADGVTLKFPGDIELCQSGYHASRKVWQALEYAPGHTLCRVHCGGQIIESDDKLVCSERTIIARIDAEKLLFDYARSCARDVLHLRDAARTTARDAAWDAAWDTAWAAARTTARDAARAAAWGTARAAAWAAARDAARAAAWGTARAAAWAAARAAAWAALRKKQRARLTRMVNKAFEENAS